jgi:hypothetical protein
MTDLAKLRELLAARKVNTSLATNDQRQRLTNSWFSAS